MDRQIMQDWGNRSVVFVEHRGGYHLRIELDDGTSLVANLTDVVERGRLPEVEELDDFACVEVVDEGLGIGWYEVKPGLGLHWSDVVACRLVDP
jgi:hypothetical protein